MDWLLGDQVQTLKVITINSLIIACLSVGATACVKGYDDPVYNSFTPYSSSGDNRTAPEKSSTPSNSTAKLGSGKDPSLELLEKVNGVEKELEKYGVRFKTDKTRDYSTGGAYGSGYSQYVLSVSVQQNAKDEDLKTAGLSPADRDALFLKLSGLWSEIVRLNFNESNDEGQRFASMKVQIFRSKVMESKAQELAKKVLSFIDAANFLNFQKTRTAKIALWKSQDMKVKSRTNGEVLEELEAALSLHSDYQKMQLSFIDDHVKELGSEISLMSGMAARSFDPSSQLRLQFLRLKEIEFQEYAKLELLSVTELSAVKALVASIKDLPTEGAFKFSTFDEQNETSAQVLNDDMLKNIESFVDTTLDRAKITIAVNVDGSFEFDKTALAKAKIEMEDFLSFRESSLGHLYKLLSEYNSVYEDLSKIVNIERDNKILLKAQLMMKKL